MYNSIKVKFTNKLRNITLVSLLFVLITTSIKPFGLIDFDSLKGKDLLVASREGAAKCTTVLKLKENNSFEIRSVCFGNEVTRGDYYLRNDTIFFYNSSTFWFNEHPYLFAVLRKNEKNKTKKYDYTFLHKGYGNSTGFPLLIKKNELKTTSKLVL